MKPGALLALFFEAAASSSCDRSDAELYLKPLGVPSNLKPLRVEYPDHGRRLHCGAQYYVRPDRHLADAPVVTWSVLPGEKFTLLMVDPDAPDRHADGSKAGTFGPWLHWLLTGCDGSTLRCSDTPVGYSGPAPPMGNHRYIFLLLKEKAAAEGPSLTGVSTSERGRWALDRFLTDNRDVLEPTALSFYYCGSSQPKNHRSFRPAEDVSPGRELRRKLRLRASH
mmetsp:Transcript_452/g.863  ORF Transcript_452/g.863 Transcript_452/m.863 type:complete len:224 (+) Transcript_452:48-719(+)